MHLHQVAKISKALVILRPRDRAVAKKGIEQFFLLAEEPDLLPTLFGHEVRVPRADLAEKQHFNALGPLLIDESELFLHTAGFLVALVIAAPDAVHAEILECVAKHLARGFGNESLPPKRLADPIAQLVFIVLLGKVFAVEADAAEAFCLQNHML